MNPISVTYPATATGSQTAIGLDWRIAPFTVSYAVIYNSGASGSVTVDHTYDDVNNPAITPVWFAGTAVTTTGEGTFTAPIQFCRITVTSLSGGTLSFKLLQATNIN